MYAFCRSTWRSATCRTSSGRASEMRGGGGGRQGGRGGALEPPHPTPTPLPACRPQRAPAPPACRRTGATARWARGRARCSGRCAGSGRCAPARHRGRMPGVQGGGWTCRGPGQGRCQTQPEGRVGWGVVGARGVGGGLGVQRNRRAGRAERSAPLPSHTRPGAAAEQAGRQGGLGGGRGGGWNKGGRPRLTALSSLWPERAYSKRLSCTTQRKGGGQAKWGRGAHVQGESVLGACRPLPWPPPTPPPPASTLAHLQHQHVGRCVHGHALHRPCGRPLPRALVLVGAVQQLAPCAVSGGGGMCGWVGERALARAMQPSHPPQHPPTRGTSAQEHSRVKRWSAASRVFARLISSDRSMQGS